MSQTDETTSAEAAGAPRRETLLRRLNLRVTRQGAEFTVKSNNIDMVMWDRTRARHRWPTQQEAPLLWMTFVAWSAARRTGAIAADLSYPDWEATTEYVEAVDADGNPLDEDDDGEGVDPTRPGPGPV